MRKFRLPVTGWRGQKSYPRSVSSRWVPSRRHRGVHAGLTVLTARPARARRWSSPACTCWAAPAPTRDGYARRRPGSRGGPFHHDRIRGRRAPRSGKYWNRRGQSASEDGTVIAARSINRDGPSRAYLGGRGVPAKSLLGVHLAVAYPAPPERPIALDAARRATGGTGSVRWRRAPIGAHPHRACRLAGRPPVN